MQGSYVQLTRGKERTDMYLTVGPEPLGDHDGHPRGAPVEPEQLLGRVLTRDGSKTLAADTPVVAEVRRWSTRRLREERDQLAALRRECPPDRSRELRLARQRAADLEQARQTATAEQRAATAGLAAVAGSVWRRREVAGARERLTMAEHGVRATTRQAEQAAERTGRLRRAEQARAGWHEQHVDLPTRERTVARELAWRHRVDARAMALDPPGWLLAELGPVPPAEQAGGRVAWIAAAVELDTWRRTHGLDNERPAPQEQRQHTRPERAGRPVDGLRSMPATRPRRAAGEAPIQGQPRTPEEPGRDRPRWRHSTRDRAGRAEPPAGQAREATATELLGAEPGRHQPGRRRDWQQVRAALERLATHRERTRDPDHCSDRHRDHRRPKRTAPHERAER
jgi:hypothetical protein